MAGAACAALLAGLVGLASPAGAAGDACAPWPGEPDPLPRVSSPDELLARWASLRAEELGNTARALEPQAPLRAHRLWRRVLCLDPGSDAAAAGLERTPAVAVHRPPIVTGAADASERDAWALSRPLAVRVPRTPAPRQPARTAAPKSADFDAALDSLARQVRRAQFEAALESAARGRAAAKTAGASVAPKRAAQLEVLAATAALALGRNDDAEQSLGRALDADPQLRLDPATTSPKVRRALDRARKARAR